jgi:hypothetical protein
LICLKTSAARRASIYFAHRHPEGKWGRAQMSGPVTGQEYGQPSSAMPDGDDAQTGTQSKDA